MALISVNNLTVKFWQSQSGVFSVKDLLTQRRKPFQSKTILEDISFEVAKGDCLGILGRNGSGKSTLLRAIAGIISPSRGRVAVAGSVAPILAIGAGLELELTGFENIDLLLSLYGHSKTAEDMDRIRDFAELPDEVLRSTVKTYSAGMVARLAFSVSLANDCDILIIDEVLAVGDQGFQQKCMQQIFEIKAQGKSIIFVSHFPDEVVKICNKALLLEHGRLVNKGNAEEICHQYKQLF